MRLSCVCVLSLCWCVDARGVSEQVGRPTASLEAPAVMHDPAQKLILADNRVRNYSLNVGPLIIDVNLCARA